jgi:hypothetical protein
MQILDHFIQRNWASSDFLYLSGVLEPILHEYQEKMRVKTDAKESYT